MSARGQDDEGRFHDPRTDDERARDRQAVTRQAALLGRRGRGDGRRSALTKAVQARSTGREDLVQFELLPIAGRSGEVAVVRGELLMRAVVREQDPGVWAMVQRSFGAEPEPVAGLLDRVVRWRNAKLGPKQLRNLARLVRAEGYEASVAHVSPLGPIVKGGTGPEPTAMTSPPAYSVTTTNAGPRVAVIDTGITAQQRGDGWLSGVERTDRNIDELSVLPDAGDPYLDFAAGHGTFAAGVVAQVAPSADVAAYAAMDTDGVGSEVRVAESMVEAARDGASVLNLSLGGPTLDNQPLLAVEVALDILGEIEREEQREILVIAAAGNDGSRRACWPAASRRVVAVAGLTAAMRPATWSNRGFWVDCSTVGEGLVSTYVQGEESAELDPSPDVWPSADSWAVWTGTSFAAPQIAGAVARVMQDAGVRPREALRQLLEGGRHVPDFGRAVRVLPGT